MLAAVAAAVVGFLLISQVRAQVGFTRRLETESEEDLTRILARLNDESVSLRDELGTLQLQLQTLGTSAERDEIARTGAARQIEELEVLAGVVPAHGPGIAVRIDDPARQLDVALLLDLVQELRDAGAEAIAVGGSRIGMASAFGGRPGGLTVDGTAVDAPYHVVAIGDPATLEGGLTIPGGAIDTLNSLTRVTVTVARQSDVAVPALIRVPALRSGHPVE
jgi:uncharacterized protein YlxW (UPF0749 family)